MTGDERTAAGVAEVGAQAWRRVVHLQGTARPDHGEFYGLAGELVQTLRALESLTGVLARQVAGYGQDRALRDDAGERPAARLAEAVGELAHARRLLAGAERSANRFWSAIGHIGVIDTGEDQ